MNLESPQTISDKTRRLLSSLPKSVKAELLIKRMEQLAQEKSRTDQAYNLTPSSETGVELNGEYMVDYESGIAEILGDIEDIENGEAQKVDQSKGRKK